MATLSGNKIKDTYQSLIKLTDNGNLTTGAKRITDGFGNNSPLFLSTTQIGVGVTPTVQFHASGDGKFGGNLTVTGNLVVEGSLTTVGTDTLTVKDPLIVLANNNTSTDAVDIGFYGKYTPSSTTLFAGLFRDESDDKFKLFKSLQVEPTTTVNISGTGYTAAALVIGGLEATTGAFANDVSFSGHISLLDNKEIKLGTDVDFKIYHNNTDAYIQNFTGDLVIENNANDKDIIFKSDDGSGGTVTYFKLDGSLVNGNLTKGAVQFPDRSKIFMGDSSDFEIFHDGTGSFIIDSGTGDLFLEGNAQVKIRKANTAELMLQCVADGAVNLYFDNSKKLETTSTGISVTGNMVASGDVQADTHFNSSDTNVTLSTNSDGTVFLRPNGKSSTTAQSTFTTSLASIGTNATVTGNIVSQTASGNSGLKVITANDAEGFLIFGDADDNSMGGMAYNNATNTLDIDCNNAVALSFDSSQNGTFAGDITVSGGDITLGGTGRIQGVDTVSASTDAANKAYVDAQIGANNELSEVLTNGNTTGGNNIVFGDSATIGTDDTLIFGAGNDLRIAHNGTDSVIRNFTGGLYIDQEVDDGDIIFRSDDGSGGKAEYLRLDGGDVETVFSKRAKFIDNTNLNIGSSRDLQIFHDGTNSFIKNNTGGLFIDQELDDGDISFRSDNGSGGKLTYLFLDGSNTRLQFNTNLITGDNNKLVFGNSGDLEIYHDGANSFVQDTGTGGLFLEGNGEVRIRKSATSEIMGKFIADGAVELYHDNSKKLETTSTGISLTGGATATGSITTSSSNGFIITDIGHMKMSSNSLFIETFTNGTGIVLNSRTGFVTFQNNGTQSFQMNSSNNATFAGNINTGKDKYLRFTGESSGSDAAILFGNSAGTGGSLTFQRNSDASTILRLDADGNVGIGTTSPIAQLHLNSSTTETLMQITNSTTGSAISDGLRFGCVGNNVTFINRENGSMSFSTNNTSALTIDNSQNATFAGDVSLADSKTLNIGTGNDLQLIHDGSNSVITNITGNLFIRNDADDADIVFQSDDGSGGRTEYFRIDGGTERVESTKSFRFADGGRVQFGNSSDLQIYHDGSNSYIQNELGNLQIFNKADDKDIIFSTDNGSGGTTAYFTLDGSTEKNVFSKDAFFGDNVKALFGASSDLEIFHDTGNSVIKDNGTGDLFLMASSAVRITNIGASEHYAKFIENGAVELYHDNSKKFETTSAGATITGNLQITGSSGDTLTLTKGSTEPSLRIEGDTDKDFVMTVSGELLTFTQNDGATDILTLDHDTKNATFAGTITASGGSSNNNDDANILTLNASEHARLLVDTSSTGGHRATLALESNGNELTLSTTGSASELTSVGNLTVTSSETTFTNDINLSAGQVKLRGDDALDHDGSNLYIKAPSIIYFYPGNNNRGNINTSGNLTLSGSIAASVDNDTSFEFGKAHIGNIGHSDHAGFSHIDQNGTGSYALLQNHIGGTFLNAASGQEIKLRINNSDAVVINSAQRTQFNGNVSIGVSPSSIPLDIELDSASEGDMIRITNSNTGSGTKRAGMIYKLTDSVGTHKDSAYIRVQGTNNNITAGASFKIFTRKGNVNPTESFAIDNVGDATFAGDITIGGKTYPKLNLTDNQGVARNFSVGTNNETFTVRNETGSADVFTIAGANNAATFAGTVDTGGNITASTSGNTFVSSVSTSTWAGMKIQASDSDSAYLFLFDTSGERARIQSTSNNDIKFSTNGGGSLALTLDSSTNATFEGTLASGNISVTGGSGGNGQIDVLRTSGANVRIQSQSAAGVLGVTTNHPLQLKTNDTTRLTISSGGDVQIGSSGTANLYLGNTIGASSSNRGMRLHTNNSDAFFDFQGVTDDSLFFRDYDGSGGIHVRHQFVISNGNIVAAGTVTQNGSPSDIKYKENIKTISNGIDKIEKLNPVEFDWNDKSDAHKIGKKEDAGFIAQEVQKVLPNLVNENVDGDLALNYEGIIPYLVQSIQELQERIKQLETN